MYELLIDNELSLNEIEKMSQFDQLMLLMSNVNFFFTLSEILSIFYERSYAYATTAYRIDFISFGGELGGGCPC